MTQDNKARLEVFLEANDLHDSGWREVPWLTETALWCRETLDGDFAKFEPRSIVSKLNWRKGKTTYQAMFYGEPHKVEGFREFVLGLDLPKPEPEPEKVRVKPWQYMKPRKGKFGEV